MDLDEVGDLVYPSLTVFLASRIALNSYRVRAPNVKKVFGHQRGGGTQSPELRTPINFRIVLYKKVEILKQSRNVISGLLLK